MDIIERSLGDLDGFVDHLEESSVAGRLYAPDVMDRGEVYNTDAYHKAYEMGFAL